MRALPDLILLIVHGFLDSEHEMSGSYNEFCDLSVSEWSRLQSVRAGNGYVDVPWISKVKLKGTSSKLSVIVIAFAVPATDSKAQAHIMSGVCPHDVLVLSDARVSVVEDLSRLVMHVYWLFLLPA